MPYRNQGMHPLGQLRIILSLELGLLTTNGNRGIATCHYQSLMCVQRHTQNSLERPRYSKMQKNSSTTTVHGYRTIHTERVLDILYWDMSSVQIVSSGARELRQTSMLLQAGHTKRGQHATIFGARFVSHTCTTREVVSGNLMMCSSVYIYVANASCMGPPSYLSWLADHSFTPLPSSLPPLSSPPSHCKI